MTQSPATPHDPTRATPWQWALLALLLLAGTWMRFHGIQREGLWLDEFYSMETSAGHCYADLHIPRDTPLPTPPHLTQLDDAPPAWRIWTSMRDDQHPPLYFILLRLWRDLFGSSDAAVRSLSLVAAVAAVWLVFELGRSLMSTGAGLWAAAITTVSQGQILYAQEARNYALLEAEVLALMLAVVRIERLGPSKPRLAGLFAATLAIVLTHYFGVAACVAAASYIALRFPAKHRRIALFAMAAAASVYCAIWLPWLIEQTRHYGPRTDWAKDPNPGSRLLALAGRLLRVPVNWFAEPPGRTRSPLPAVMALILVLPLLRLRKVPGLLLPILIVACWLALPAGLDVLRGTHLLDYSRYAVGAAPAAFLLAAGLLADRRGVVKHLIPAALVTYCLTALPATYSALKGDWRTLGRELASHATDRDMVVYYSPLAGDWYAGGLYLAQDWYAPKLNSPLLIATHPLARPALDAVRNARVLWIATDPSEFDAPTFAPGFHVTRTVLLHGAGLLYRLEPDAAPVIRPVDKRTNSTPTTHGT